MNIKQESLIESPIELVKTTDQEKAIYRKMREQRYNKGKAYDDALFDFIWEDMNSPAGLLFTIFIKKEQPPYDDAPNVCGFIEIPFLRTAMPEISIDLLDGYQGKGIGTQAMQVLLSHMNAAYELSSFLWKVKKDNLASIHLVEKLGGQLLRESHDVLDYILHC